MDQFEDSRLVLDTTTLKLFALGYLSQLTEQWVKFRLKDCAELTKCTAPINTLFDGINVTLTLCSVAFSYQFLPFPFACRFLYLLGVFLCYS